MPLIPGQSVDGELTAGSTSVYLLALDAGVFVRVLVDQGIDVVARLIDPKGELLIKFDKLSSGRPEQVLWVTRTPGTYRLEIAASARVVGPYQLKFEVSRPATERDHKRHDAELLFAEGYKLRRKQDQDSRRRAEGKLQEAIALWQELDDRTRYVDGLYLLASTYAYRDLSLAIETFETTIALLEDEADLHQKAAAVHQLGWLHHQAGELRRAVELYRQAIPLRQLAGDPSGEANTYNNLGLAHKLLGEVPEALANYRLALARFRDLGDSRREALALHNLGKGLLSTGLLPEALDKLGQALGILQNLGDPGAQTSTLIAIGQVHVERNELDRALEAQRRALTLSREAGKRNLEAVALSDIAWAYLELGRFEEALAPLEEALAIFRTLGNRHDEAMTLYKIGRALDALGQDAFAADHHRQALALFEATEHRQGQIMALHSMAQVERQLGRLPLARRHLETALAEIERLRTLPQSHTLRYSYFATKQSTYEAYVDLLMELHRRHPQAGHDAEALTASERARARSQLDALTESDADLRRGTSPELRQREAALEEEIESLEIQRRQLLDDGAGRPRLSAIERRLRSLFLEHDRVQADIRRASPQYAALTQPRPLAAEEIQRQVVDHDTILLEYDLGAERSYLWVVTPGEVRSFELPPRQVIETAAKRAYGFLSSSHLTVSRVPTELALNKLSRLLLQPVAELLADKRLLIISDGALQYIPFSALPEPLANEQARGSGDDGKHAPPLGQGHEIVSMPSASTLAVLRSQIRVRRRPRGIVAVLADPVFELEDLRFRQQDPDQPSSATRGAVPEKRRYDRLIYSQREADDILALAPAGETFAAIGFEASREVVMSGSLAGYRFLHFATHGVLNTEHPGLSRLVMSQFDRQGTKRDGFVFAHEIYNLELAADLVVLSACETALGAEIRGEGLLGLTQGFMYAGAASVLVSLWNVDDQATAELMAHLYRSLLVDGMRPAAALRAAQAAISRESRWQAPYFWAGFVLQGEWR